MTQRNLKSHVYLFDSAPIGTNLVVHHTPKLRSLEEECYGLYDNSMKEEIDKKLAEFQKPNSGQFDGTLLSLQGFSLEDNKRILDVVDMKYSTYQALKERLNREKGHEHTLTRCVPLIAFTETREGYFIFGHRAGNHMSDLYLPPAGFSNHEGKVPDNYFSALSVEEIQEELGIEVNEKEVNYAGLSSGDDSRNITVITHTILSYTRKEVEEAFTELKERLSKEGKRIEHKHLIYLQAYPVALSSFLSGDYTGSLNPIRDIYFEKGYCIRGPAEIKNKKYGQIGNGIAGFLAILQQKFPEKDYKNLVKRIEESELGLKIQHMPLEKKFNL